MVEAANYILTLGDDVVRFLSVLRVRNEGDAPSGPFEWPLPPDATGGRVLIPADVPAVRVDGARLSDPRGLAPGEARDYTLRFELPLSRQGTLATLPISLPVRQLLVLTDPRGLTVAGVEGLQAGGEIDFQGRPLRQYGATGLAPGAPVRVLLRPARAAVGAGRAVVERLAGNPWFVAAFAFTAGATVAFVVMGRRRGRGEGGAHVEPRGIRAAILAGPATADELPEPAATLVRQIAALDLAREDGRLDPGEHERRRADLKRRLLAYAGVGGSREPDGVGGRADGEAER